MLIRSLKLEGKELKGSFVFCSLRNRKQNNLTKNGAIVTGPERTVKLSNRCQGHEPT